MSAFANLATDEDVACVNLWGIPSMRASSADQLFSELNFHRDTIASFGLPLLVWLTNSQVQRLASRAPDFWSRRTAVYFFNKPSARELLERLFSRATGVKKKPLSDIEEAFAEILASEKALGKCLKRSQHFSVELADEQIKKLESNLDYLIGQCHNKRQLEVALWLWNSTQMEGQLQFFVKSLQPEDRNVYEYLYTDRSEVILYLAEQMPGVLNEYAQSVKEKVRLRKRANLLTIFKSVAFTRLGEVLNEIALRERRSVHTLPVWSDDVLEYETIESGDDVGPAVYDLESWLSGYSTKQPAFFSVEEARILKALYSISSDPDDIAAALGLSMRETKKRIAQLQTRVELYLAGEWLTSHKVKPQRSARSPQRVARRT